MMLKKAYVVDLSLGQDFFDYFNKDIGGYLKTVYVNGFEMKYPDLCEASLVVISGSQYSINDDYEWLDYAVEYYLRCFEKSIPVIGICYGHQLIARAHGGKEAVGKAESPEMGFIEVKVLEDGPIYSGLPGRFKVIGAHYDEVKIVPDDFKRTAESDKCRVQSMLNASKAVMGIQFHPEMKGSTAKKLFTDEILKMKGYGIDLEKVISEMPDDRFGAELIFKNFIDEFVKRGER
ncbi:gamma-glutamyl-gamma-aminobutyrate hydrolase family protein [candidate division WOR-3 bacterium]|nr:gamma-glutamyl-gamma-aminobutyrate hydrolase family protein [candidate division WOR-3 bacterium]